MLHNVGRGDSSHPQAWRAFSDHRPPFEEQHQPQAAPPTSPNVVDDDAVPHPSPVAAAATASTTTKQASPKRRRPRASNPRYQVALEYEPVARRPPRASSKAAPPLRPRASQPSTSPRSATVAHREPRQQLPPQSQSQPRQYPKAEPTNTNPWIEISNVPPLSSLEAMVQGVEDALRQELVQQEQFRQNTTKPNATLPLPLLEPGQAVQRAHLILSPFGRPMGWRFQLQHASWVPLLLRLSKQERVRCSWKVVQIKQWEPTKPGDSPRPDAFQDDGSMEVESPSAPSVQADWPTLSDAVVRIENCPPHTTYLELLNLFSRFDLQDHPPQISATTVPDSASLDTSTNSPPTLPHESFGSHAGGSILPWQGVLPTGKPSPIIYWVQFADASWARAAVREQQNVRLRDKELRLVQYPRQLL